uniref:CSON002410 protein n=1 Tax=Culicoides sonorensis TaxID=179676 RepID=A0A336MIY5_CULSO
MIFNTVVFKSRVLNSSKSTSMLGYTNISARGPSGSSISVPSSSAYNVLARNMIVKYLPPQGFSYFTGSCNNWINQINMDNNNEYMKNVNVHDVFKSYSNEVNIVVVITTYNKPSSRGMSTFACLNDFDK